MAGGRETLLRILDRSLRDAEAVVRAIDPAVLRETRYVGRKRLPVTVIGLLTHIAEHTQRHVGQAITAARWVAAESGEGVICLLRQITLSKEESHDDKKSFPYLDCRRAAGSGRLDGPAQGRGQQRQPTPNDTLKSPEVLADNKVTFRIYAPKATEVTVSGDWIAQGRGTGGKLEKDDQGVWSLTVGPLVPDIYSYGLTVDGVRTIDPKNAWIKQGVTSLDNMFEVPGPEAAFHANTPVPHGQVHIDWYHSSTLDTMRSMHVYTPPGYESWQCEVSGLLSSARRRR